MGNKGFIAYDPELARIAFNSDILVTIYYEKLLRYDAILPKDSKGFFTRSAAQITSATCISRKQQERTRKWLESHQYIQTCLKPPENKQSPQMHFLIIDSKRIT
jgi:hypothetical protein